MPKPTRTDIRHDFVRASALVGYREQAEELGLEPRALLRAVGYPVRLLDQLDGLVSYRGFLRLLDLSAVRSGEAFFGLKLGLRQGMEVFGPLLYLIRHAATVGDALAELQQFFHVHMGAATVRMVQDGGRIQLAYQIGDPSLTGVVQGAELAIGVGLRLMQTLCGAHWRAGEVTFRHQPHGPLRDYRRLLGVRPRFNAGSHALWFDAQLLTQPLSDADPSLHRLMREHVEHLQQVSDRDLPRQLGSVLRNMLDRGRVTVDDVASYMATSRRTLQRRLAEQGTTFQAVLDETRKSMAQHYLRDSSLQMSQLATLLGYSEQSAFTHAFKRWFGVAPSQWRKSRRTR